MQSTGHESPRAGRPRCPPPLLWEGGSSGGPGSWSQARVGTGVLLGVSGFWVLGMEASQRRCSHMGQATRGWGIPGAVTVLGNIMGCTSGTQDF